MSAKTDALEQAVLALMQARTTAEADPSPRARAAADHGFARVMKLAAPRIRHFIGQYGLTDHQDDAQQVCAIALHRAVDAYNPAKAKFTTFVNWQLRGELQALRFRLRTDQRSSARKVGAATVSLDVLAGEDGASFDDMLIDDAAEAATEAGASAVMADRVVDRLVDQFIARSRAAAIGQAGRRGSKSAGRRRRTDVAPGLPKYIQVRPGTVHPDDLARIEARLDRDRHIVRHHLLADDLGGDAPACVSNHATDVSPERERQIARRALRDIAMNARMPRGMAAARQASAAFVEDITAEMASAAAAGPANPVRRAVH